MPSQNIHPPKLRDLFLDLGYSLMKGTNNIALVRKLNML